MPFVHVPVVQVLPTQQGWPLPPQAVQVACPPDVVAFWHTKPGEQVGYPPGIGYAQQGWLAPPHARQVACPLDAVWHRVFGAVQRLFAQQAFPKPPQVPHAPAEQVHAMTLLQVVPTALHVEATLPLPSATQHPPARQRLPGQHGPPGAPQAAQTCAEAELFDWQKVLVAVQRYKLVQQSSLLPPHVPQAPDEQVPESGLGHMLPLAVQTPTTQHPLFEQALPAQQAWSGPPQDGSEGPSTPFSASIPAALSSTSAESHASTVPVAPPVEAMASTTTAPPVPGRPPVEVTPPVTTPPPVATMPPEADAPPEPVAPPVEAIASSPGAPPVPGRPPVAASPPVPAASPVEAGASATTAPPVPSFPASGASVPPTEVSPSPTLAF